MRREHTCPFQSGSRTDCICNFTRLPPPAHSACEEQWVERSTRLRRHRRRCCSGHLNVCGSREWQQGSTVYDAAGRGRRGRPPEGLWSGTCTRAQCPISIRPHARGATRRVPRSRTLRWCRHPSRCHCACHWVRYRAQQKRRSDRDVRWHRAATRPRCALRGVHA